MKVLITGATGFVGSHLCDKLVEEGHEVYALIRSEKKAKTLPSATTLIKGDLSFDSIQKWTNHLPSDLDSVIHTAGIVHSFNIEKFYQINTKSTLHLIEALAKSFSELHFVFISSLAAAGPSPIDRPLDEKTKLAPPSHYGKSKAKAEVSLRELAPPQWKTTIIRPPMVIGPRDTAVLDVYKMVKSGIVLSTGMKGLKKRYSFICIFDLISVITRSLHNQEQQHDTFFSAHPEQIYFHEIITEIKKQLKKRTITLYIPLFLIRAISKLLRLLNRSFGVDARLTPDKIEELAPMAWMCSGLHSQEVLNIKYQWDLKSTIEVTYKDYHQRGWL